MFQCQECKYLIPNPSDVCPNCDSSDIDLAPIKTTKITHGFVEQEFDVSGRFLGARFIASDAIYYRSCDGSLASDKAMYQPYLMLQPEVKTL